MVLMSIFTLDASYKHAVKKINNNNYLKESTSLYENLLPVKNKGKSFHQAVHGIPV